MTLMASEVGLLDAVDSWLVVVDDTWLVVLDAEVELLELLDELETEAEDVAEVCGAEEVLEDAEPEVEILPLLVGVDEVGKTSALVKGAEG